MSPRSTSIFLQAARGVLHSGAVVVGASAFTLAFFLVLPLLQRINQPLTADLSLTSVDTTLPPPPPPPPEEEPEEEEEP